MPWPKQFSASGLVEAAITMSDKNWTLDGEGFLLTEPLEYRPWVNFLGNGEYGLRISHLGDAFSTTLQEPRRVITNYDFSTPIKGRFLYIQDASAPGSGGNSRGPLWNPGFLPTRQRLDRYSCRHAPGYTRFDSTLDEIQAVSTHFLPRTGCFEIWRFNITNNSPRVRTIKVTALCEYLLYDSFGVDPVYYSWYTNSQLESDGRTVAIYKTDASPVWGFFHSLKTANSWEGSLTAFRGNGDLSAPAGLAAEQLSGTPGSGDPYIGSFQFDITLQPGESWDNAIFIGEGKPHLEDARTRLPTGTAVDTELSAVSTLWQSRLSRPEFQRTRDPLLRDWLSSFFPYQIWQQSTGLVRSTWRGYRDVAQDAIGMSYFDLTVCRELIITLLDKQHADGRCLRQWNTAGSYHDERDFRDLPFWLPLAVDKYLLAGGNPDILSIRRKWIDDAQESTLWEHMLRGLQYSLRFGPHDLLLMGVGDWNDALSGTGPEGESLWLNQMAYLVLGIMERLQNTHGKAAGLELPLDCPALRERLYQGVMSGWTGEWFLRAYHQDGRVIGGLDRIFLLPQAWFTISGMAERDPVKAKLALDVMVARLDNPAGLLKCHPAFDQFDPLVGNLSALAPGMAENFAVYNHAAAFAIYALFQAGRQEEAIRYLKRLIPIYKDPSLTRSEPFVLVNFYNGGYYPQKAGQGGIPWLTGTVNWFAMIYFDQIAHNQIEL